MNDAELKAAAENYRAANAKYEAHDDVLTHLNDKAEAGEVGYSEVDEYRADAYLSSVEDAYAAAQKLLNLLGYGPGEEKGEHP